MRSSFTAFLGQWLASAIPETAPLPKDPMRFPEERTGRRRAKKYAPAVSHDEPRFVRKTRRFGSEYRPGKLFKGHRI